MFGGWLPWKHCHASAGSDARRILIVPIHNIYTFEWIARLYDSAAARNRRKDYK